MNMFKSRRKAKGQSEAVEGPFHPNSPPATFRTVKNLKRRNKNIPEESKPVFDLSNALPGENDFRTSLLMSNLSARFSMLREQDDPNSKLGKASDDSVLFPKRASRMNLFNHSALSDLAEVESVYSTFRPPFADRDRSNSFGDGYESDSGSVMNRSRPGEGNTLFGGRQRFYRIPTTSARNVADTESFTTGKHLFEHDVAPSQFQQYWRKEKDKSGLASGEESRASIPTTEVEDNSEIASPATIFSKNRGTHSSTNSAPRRSSTAATSVASEPVASRDSSNMEDDISIKPAISGSQAPQNQNSASGPKSRDDPIPNRFVSSLKKSQRPLPIYNSTSLRNASSPILPITQPLDFGFNVETRPNNTMSRRKAGSPTPASVAETGNVLAHSLQPNDRGKATALGLFNKPAREFDEHQFNQRQLQMHEEQLSTMSNNSRSTSRASNDVQGAQQDSVVASPSHMSIDRNSTPQVPPVPSTPASPAPSSNRASKASGRGTPPLRPRSKSSASTVAISHVKARIDSLIRKQNAELVALEAEKLGTPDFRQSADMSDNKENFAGAFFDNDDESDADESSGVTSSRANSSHIADESHIHPAFRNSYRVSDAYSRRSNHSNFSKTRSILDDDRRRSSRLQVPKTEAESSTLQSGLGLSGLIRTHLRQSSDKSSILPRPDSSITPSMDEPSQRNSSASAVKVISDNSEPDSSEPNIERRTSTSRLSQAPLTPNTVLSQVAQHFLSQAMRMTDGDEEDDAQEATGVEQQDENADSPEHKPWRDELEPKHQRGGSSETTKERREFDEELAARRRKIREGLKSVVERDRSSSPATASRGSSVTMQAFVQQRAVTDPPQPKAMKLLGLQSNGTLDSSDDNRGRDMGPRSQTRGSMSDGVDGKDVATAHTRLGREISTERQYSPRSATPPAIRQGRRDRSTSNTGGRSKSRTGVRDQKPPVPGNRDYFATWDSSTPSPVVQSYKRSERSLSKRNGYQGPRAASPEVDTHLANQTFTEPSPMSPVSPAQVLAMETPKQAGAPSSAGRTTPSSGRATPTNAFSRKRSVTKTMISEPTFVSSTSSVPLVHLPEAQHSASTTAPPLPAMNPRRRGNTAGEAPVLSPSSSAFMWSTPLEPVPASPVIADFGSEGPGRKTPSPKKLRKANSEGGSMAAKARQQALAAQLTQEQTRSPALPIFPNRSATALGMSTDGGMF